MPSLDPPSEPAFAAFDPARDGWPALAEATLHLWLVPHRPGKSSLDALRPCIARYLDIDEPAVQLAHSAAGKPCLASPPADLRFSASHSGDALLMGFVCSGEIGVDIERAKPRPRALELARRYFAGHEADALARLPPAQHEVAFYRLWTAKEAMLKGLGHGLAHGLDWVAFEFGPDGLQLAASGLDLTPLAPDPQPAWNLREFAPLPGYRATVAWSGPGRRIFAWRMR